MKETGPVFVMDADGALIPIPGAVLSTATAALVTLDASGLPARSSTSLPVITASENDPSPVIPVIVTVYVDGPPPIVTPVLAVLEWFTTTSDIDLAARGLAPDDYFTAVARLQDLSPEFKVDLVAVERCKAALRESIAREGVIL